MLLIQMLSTHCNRLKKKKNKNKLVCNGIQRSIFRAGGRVRQANASVRAAFVHVVGDLLQSISVLVSAIVIFFKVRTSALENTRASLLLL